LCVKLQNGQYCNSQECSNTYNQASATRNLPLQTQSSWGGGGYGGGNIWDNGDGGHTMATVALQAITDKRTYKRTDKRTNMQV